MNFTPFTDKVLVEPIGNDSIIKSNISEISPEKGRIVSIGEGVVAGMNGVELMKKGDIIHFLAYGCSTAIGTDGKPYYVVTVSPQTILGIEYE